MYAVLAWPWRGAHCNRHGPNWECHSMPQAQSTADASTTGLIYQSVNIITGSAFLRDTSELFFYCPAFRIVLIQREAFTFGSHFPESSAKCVWLNGKETWEQSLLRCIHAPTTGRRCAVISMLSHPNGYEHNKNGWKDEHTRDLDADSLEFHSNVEQ